MLARESSVSYREQNEEQDEHLYIQVLCCIMLGYKRSVICAFREQLQRQQRKGFALLVGITMNQQVLGQAGASHVVGSIASLPQELATELATLNSSTAPLGAPWPPPGQIIVGKVPHLTRNVDNGEYSPHYVSIGPLHRISNPQLARDEDKMRRLNALLSAASPSKVKCLCNKLTAHLENDARRCYAEIFADMPSDKFVRMLLLDGCYILSHFGNIQPAATNGGASATTANGSVPPSVSVAVAACYVDMRELVALVSDVFYLAENQIPFFVLEEINQLSTSPGNTSALDEVRKYAFEILVTHQYVAPAEAPATVTPAPTTSRNEQGNLLHLLHTYLQPTELTGSRVRDGESVGRWRTATDYYFAGLKFKSQAISGTGNVRCILDVKLDSDGGTLEIPCLNIDSETWRLLRNLMELEQRNPNVAESHVTAYCIFMSQIACTEKDVELLWRKGVIVHGLGTNGEVAKFFADLGKGIVYDPDDPGQNYLRPTCQELEKRFRSYPRRWMAWLRRKYTNPWLAVGLLAAAIGLACGVVQAVYSVLSYKKG